MLGVQLSGYLNRFGKYFYPLSIIAVVITLGLVLVSLPTRFAVFGLYAFFGLVGGAVIYYWTDESGESHYSQLDQRGYRVGVYVSVFVTIGIVVLTSEPILVAPGLLVGYGLFVRQFMREIDPRRELPQLTALFLLSPVVKYLTAGRYIGHGDLLTHVKLVDNITASGSIDAIATASYYDVPGLHVIAATISSVSGLGAYDAVLVTGLVAFSLVVPAVYLLAYRITEDGVLALSTAFAIVLFSDISFFVSYAFPQSLATVIIVVLMLLGSMVSRDAIKYRVTGIFVIVTLALSFTHHLTQVLFLPVVVSFLLFYTAFGSFSLVTLLRKRQIVLLGLASLLNGFVIWQIGFFDRLLEALILQIQGGLLGGHTQSATVALGVTPPSASLSTAVEWLVSPYALYLILLLVVLSLGVVVFLQGSSYSAAYMAVALTGLLGAPLILETPLSVKSLIRIVFPWHFAFAFIVGISLQQFRRRHGSVGYSHILVAILVVLAGLAPLVAPDNYYGLDPRPTEQTSFSDEEFSELQATEFFIDRQDKRPAVFWDTRLVMNRFGESDLSHARIKDEKIILPPGHFVYRSGFTDHRLAFKTNGQESLFSTNVYISEQWLASRIEIGNHVYTAGGTGMLWSPTERPL